MLSRLFGRLSPRHWQIFIGQPLARILQGVLFHTGMSDRFEIVTFPDQDIYQITVFRLDMSGESLYEGSERRGFEFFRVEIKYPRIFILILFDDLGRQRGGSRLCKSPKCLKKEAKNVLEEILFSQWDKSIKSRR